ncbi:MAG: hypothetical protein AAF697_08135 [Pseudomonadota bacterium]
MNWSLALVIPLALLMPGFAALLCFRAGTKVDLLHQPEDKPNSINVVTAVVGVSMVVHFLGTVVLLLIEWAIYRHQSLRAFSDPLAWLFLNEVQLSNATVSVAAILIWIIALSVITGWISWLIAIRPSWARYFANSTVEWLRREIQESETERPKYISAHVMTKSAHNGYHAAYRGTVQRITLDEAHVMRMLVLRSVEKFVVRVGVNGVVGQFAPTGDRVKVMHFTGDEIANAAFKVEDNSLFDAEYEAFLRKKEAVQEADEKG